MYAFCFRSIASSLYVLVRFYVESSFSERGRHELTRYKTVGVESAYKGWSSFGLHIKMDHALSLHLLSVLCEYAIAAL